MIKEKLRSVSCRAWQTDAESVQAGHVMVVAYPGKITFVQIAFQEVILGNNALHLSQKFLPKRVAFVAGDLVVIVRTLLAAKKLVFG